MDINKILILYTLNLVKGERSIFGVYHLLQGKTSVQTIQDGHLFECLFLFGSISKINREDFLKHIYELERKKMIILVKEDYYQVTDKGEDALTKGLYSIPFIYHLNGWKYKRVTKSFWLRLTLFIQCLSNILGHNHSFIPVTQDKRILFWVKRKLTIEKNRQLVATTLFKELNELFSTLEVNDAEIVVRKLTSATEIGMTNEQIAQQLGLEKSTIDVRLMAIIHQLLQVIDENQAKFPLLFSFYKDLISPIKLTETAKATYLLWRNGMDIEAIAQFRRLKKNTIEDHFVEMSIAIPNFAIESFVSEKEQKEILSVINEIKSTRLKKIKERLPNGYDYFMIRLVLTKTGGRE
ncbi:helix-turn-helix domain-containing protein [Bacillus sp. FJAT-45350]|uniref:helix-turn-helix domain-containing protein n=1 Tax=Bacillus sp. FJAT-45350 TaxID=2011014 RepID=UPI000BB6F435|nr:helix-turn-helix domain-containing protein [Bacillus sp. FJAT-45350]